MIGAAEGALMDDPNRVGPRSWYWPRRYKILFAVAIIIAIVVIFVLLNPGPGYSSPRLG
jgi:hypothetical protein